MSCCKTRLRFYARIIMLVYIMSNNVFVRCTAVKPQVARLSFSCSIILIYVMTSDLLTTL